MLKTVSKNIYTCDICGQEVDLPCTSFQQNFSYTADLVNYVRFDVKVVIPYSGPHTHACQKCILDILKKYINCQEIPF